MGEEIEVEKYKEFTIILDKESEKFIARKNGDDSFKANTLRDIKKVIDSSIFTKKFGEKIKAIMSTGWGRGVDEIENVEITSIKRERYSFDVWVKAESGRREKTTLHRLFKPTEENRNKLNKIVELQRKKDEIEEKIEEIDKSLERFAKKDFGFEDE